MTNRHVGENSKPAYSESRRNFLKQLSGLVMFGIMDGVEERAKAVAAIPLKTVTPPAPIRWYSGNFCIGLKSRFRLLKSMKNAMEEESILMSSETFKHIMPNGINGYLSTLDKHADFMAKAVADSLDEAFCLDGMPENLGEDPRFKEICDLMLGEQNRTDLCLNGITTPEQILAETKRLYELRNTPEVIADEIKQIVKPKLDKVLEKATKAEFKLNTNGLTVTKKVREPYGYNLTFDRSEQNPLKRKTWGEGARLVAEKFDKLQELFPNQIYVLHNIRKGQSQYVLEVFKGSEADKFLGEMAEAQYQKFIHSR